MGMERCSFFVSLVFFAVKTFRGIWMQILGSMPIQGDHEKSGDRPGV